MQKRGSVFGAILGMKLPFEAKLVATAAAVAAALSNFKGYLS